MSHNAERQTDHKFPNCIPEEPFEEVGEGISSWTENAGADEKIDSHRNPKTCSPAEANTTHNTARCY
jgi:hypothetical protein